MIENVPEVNSSLQLSIFTQTVGMASSFRLPSLYKNMLPPHLSSNKSGQDDNQGDTLAFRPLGSVARVYSMFPLTTEKTRKWGIFWSKEAYLDAWLRIPCA
jgi:hypothetical protein